MKPFLRVGKYPQNVKHEKQWTETGQDSQPLLKIYESTTHFEIKLTVHIVQRESIHKAVPLLTLVKRSN